MTNKIIAMTIIGAVLVLTIISPNMVFATSNTAHGPQTITQTFFVSAQSATLPSFGGSGLVNTGINLVPTGSYTVTVTGDAIWATGDGAGGCSAASDASGSGAGIGAPDNSCGYVGPSTAGSDSLAPGLTAFSLVGQAGSGTFFQLGTSSTITGQSGPLTLGFNDNFYGDNTKGFSVTVSYTCYPGNGFGDTNHIHCGPPGQN